MNTPTESIGHPTLNDQAIDRPVSDPTPLPTLITLPTAIRVSLIGSFCLLGVAALFFAKEILLPIVLAFMLTLTLSPVVRYLTRYRIPAVVSSLAIVLVVIGSSAAALYYLSGPVSGWLEDLPRTGLQIRAKISALRAPVDAAVNASKQVEEIASASDDPRIQKVVVQQPGLLARAAGGALAAAATAGVTVVLLFFLLASGRLFYEKLVRVLPTLTEKKRAIRVVNAVEEEVSTYLLTIAAINATLGVVIAATMWTLGLPNAVLWGVLAAVLNFLPYVGALIGIAIIAMVSLVSFDSLSNILLPPALYFVFTILEGQIFTPMLLGRRLEMNAVAVFLAVAIWGWLWGVIGALLAVPLLVTLRVLCDHFDNLSGLGEFLSGQPAPAIEVEVEVEVDNAAEENKDATLSAGVSSDVRQLHRTS